MSNSGQKLGPIVVVAIGGNSLIKDSGHMSVLDQLRATGETSHHLAPLVSNGYRLVVTHGNGPQVGFILLRSEVAKNIIHQVPLESCVADTQGATGFHICMTLNNELRRCAIDKSVAAIVTQVLVDASDPAFSNPSKPIGPFYTKEDAEYHSKNDGWFMKEDAGRGWRRMVPSPKPLKIIEEPIIKKLLDEDVVVVAVGGGGIPVVENEYGDLIGKAAVVDKDFASSMLAVNLKAEKLVISTSVDQVYINFGTAKQRPLDCITAKEAKTYLTQGQFAPGSMGPKIEAAILFLEQGGKEVIITQPHLLEKAMAGKTGTHIVPG